MGVQHRYNAHCMVARVFPGSADAVSEHVGFPEQVRGSATRVVEVSWLSLRARIGRGRSICSDSWVNDSGTWKTASTHCTLVKSIKNTFRIAGENEAAGAAAAAVLAVE